MTTIPELVREYYNGDLGTLPPFKTRLLDCTRTTLLVTCGISLNWLAVSVNCTTLLVTRGISLNWLTVSVECTTLLVTCGISLNRLSVSVDCITLLVTCGIKSKLAVRL